MMTRFLPPDHFVSNRAVASCFVSYVSKNWRFIIFFTVLNDNENSILDRGYCTQKIYIFPIAHFTMTVRLTDNLLFISFIGHWGAKVSRQLRSLDPPFKNSSFFPSSFPLWFPLKWILISPIMWRFHCHNPLLCIEPNIFSFNNTPSSSLFLLILHSLIFPFFTGPEIFHKIFVSKTISSLSSIFLNDHHVFITYWTLKYDTYIVVYLGRSIELFPGKILYIISFSISVSSINIDSRYLNPFTLLHSPFLTFKKLYISSPYHRIFNID